MAQPSTRRRDRLTRAFLADAGGAAAVEFAIVALPFLALCGAIVQVAFLIWAAQNFDRTLTNAVRTLFTGQFQLSTAGQTNAATLLAALNTSMCGTATAKILTLFDCGAVKIDVSTASSFGSSASATPLDANTGSWNASFGTNYTCAKPGTIVIVTAAVKVPAIFSLLGLNLKTFADGSHLLMSTAVFRTEPYQTTGTAACAS